MIKTVQQLKDAIQDLPGTWELVVSIDVMPSDQTGPSFVVIELFKDPNSPELIIRCDQSDLPTSVKNERARIKAYVKNWKPEPGTMEQAAAIMNDPYLNFILLDKSKSKKDTN